MINFKDILILIEKNNSPYVRISDYHGNKIAVIENNSVNATIKELEDLEPMLKSYGKLEISATDKAGAAANYKGAFKWVMFFDKAIANNQMSGMQGANWGNQQWGKVPDGYVSHDIMMLKLEAIQKQIEHNKEIEALKKANENKADQYMQYMPFIMGALGHDETKIEKMIKWGMMGKQMNSAGIAYVPPTNTLTFKDVEKMSNEDKNAKLQSLLDSLSTKVSVEHMIILLEAIDKKPELVEKAINFLPML